ncbi:hypothetical protein [Pasteuria penetrans]|nr:hypothetical protein [Pasteuria penetrans]
MNRVGSTHSSEETLVNEGGAKGLNGPPGPADVQFRSKEMIVG